MSTENKAAVRRFFEEGLIALDELLDPAFVLHDAPPGLPPGIEGCKVIDVMFRTAFPDYKHTIHDLIADGDKDLFTKTEIKLNDRSAVDIKINFKGGFVMKF